MGVRAGRIKANFFWYRIKVYIPIILFILLIVYFISNTHSHSHSRSYSHDLYPFQSVQQQKQFQHLVNSFRCVVCQNESLAASDVDIARQLKQEIYRMVKNNASNDAIKQYLLQRYGNFILLKPPLITETYFLWFSPFVLLFLGGWIFLSVMRK